MRRALDSQKGAGQLEGASGKEDLFGKRYTKTLSARRFGGRRVLLKVLTIQKGARYGWDWSMASGNEAALCQNGIKLLSGC